MDNEYKTLLYYLDYLKPYYHAMLYKRLTSFQLEVLLHLGDMKDIKITVTKLSRKIGFPNKTILKVLEKLEFYDLVKVENSIITYKNKVAKYWLWKETDETKLQEAFNQDKKLIKEVWEEHRRILKGVDIEKEGLLLDGN